MEVFSPEVSEMGYREKGTQVGHGEGQDVGGIRTWDTRWDCRRNRRCNEMLEDGTYEMMQEGWDREWGIGGMGCRKERMQVGWNMG